MTAATFRFKVLPKRMLKKSEAASYCGVALKRFDAEVPCQPVRMPTGDDLYDVQDLDRWIDSIKAGAADDDVDAIIGRLGK